MKTSKKGLDIIKKHEGFRNAPYLCPANVPTIGFGSTYYEDGRRVKLTDEPITRKRATQLLKNVLNKFEEEVVHSVSSSVNQNQFDALASFIYNVGGSNFRASTLLKKVNANPEDENIKVQFSRWNKATVNGKRIALKGLTKRRNEEAYLYFTPIYIKPLEKYSTNPDE
jgi:lysozyme